MPSEVIPLEVTDFINRNIDSIAQLEALLLVRRDPAEKWNAEKIAGHLYLDSASPAQWSRVEQSMTEILNATLQGAVAMSSFVAALFFLRFWQETQDKFFLLFTSGFSLTPSRASRWHLFRLPTKMSLCFT